MEQGITVLLFSIYFAGLMMMLSLIDKDIVKNNKQNSEIIKLLKQEHHEISR